MKYNWNDATDEQKFNAVKHELSLVTHIATKDDLMNMLRWLWDKYQNSVFIHCQNSKCVHYFEDSCFLNLNGKMVSFDSGGECRDFKPGINEAYADMEEANREEDGRND